MSGNTLLRDSLGAREGIEEFGQSTYISVIVGRQPTPWEQFDTGLRRTLQANGYEQPDEPIEEVRPPLANPWHLVAPGVVVRESEFEARYGFLDLDTLRHRMRPEVFQAFVRHIGAIEGRQGGDANELLKEYGG
jgi:hypothetical protein